MTICLFFFIEDSDGEESDSSLDEFTVLVPPCFDPDAPLTDDPIPVKVIDVKSYKRRNSISSPFFDSLVDVDPCFDEDRPSSLPNMSLPDKDDVQSTTATNEQTTAPIVYEALQDSPAHIHNTPSGSLHSLPTQEPATRETPVSRQPGISPRDGIPLVTQPTTVMTTNRTNENERSDSNIVSEVLNTAMDVVTSAGRAVGNLFNVSSQTTATYMPQNDEVTLNPRGSNMVSS